MTDPLKNPTLSVLIPTAGRETLQRCLESIRPQLGPDDEVIVIGDTHDGPLPRVEALVAEYGSRYRYLAHDAGYHAWGHPQINEGQRHATKGWIVGQDDDDIFTPDAFAAIRRAIGNIAEPLPLLFRFVSHYGHVFWDEIGVIEQGRIGGHCLVQPNLPGKLGVRGDHYEADFQWIVTALAHYDNCAVWRPEIISVARPGS